MAYRRRQAEIPGPTYRLYTSPPSGMPKGGWGTVGPYAANPATMRAVARGAGRYAPAAQRILRRRRTSAAQTQWRTLRPQVNTRIQEYIDRGDYERAWALYNTFAGMGKRIGVAAVPIDIEPQAAAPVAPVAPVPEGPTPEERSRLPW